MVQQVPNTGTQAPSRAEPAARALERTRKKNGHARLLLFLESQARVLDLVTRNAPLTSVLDELARAVEQQVEGAVCSILLLTEDHQHLRHGGGPSLPEHYMQAIDGVPI